MNIEFEKLKQEIETERGRPIDQAEEIELKSLYYFGKGVKLKNQLESEPERLGNICTRVLDDIRGRIERYRASGYKSRVLEAVKDFIGSKSKRRERRKSGKQKTKQRNLWL